QLFPSTTLFRSKVLGENYREREYSFTLQPIADIHLSNRTDSGMAETTHPTLLLILAGIAFLILLIACINFTTMAIGRSTTRAEEVGVRKTMGADRSEENTSEHQSREHN